MQCAQRSAAQSRHEPSSRVAPAFSHRASPLCFRPCGARRAATATPAALATAAVRQEQRAARQQCRVAAAARPGVYLFGFGGDDDYEEEYTVAKVQVAMFGDVNKWQGEMERLSELYDTEDEESLQFILQETVTKLLRNLSYCGYGQTAGKVFDNLDSAEQKFNQVSLEERTKYDEETYSNVDGRRRRRSIEVKAEDNVGMDKWLCATIVVAVEGNLKLPKINGVADLRKALSTLGSVPADCLLAFELLWTPQAEGDSYSKDDLLANYPSLAML